MSANLFPADPILARLLLAGIITGAGLALYWGLNRLILARAQHNGVVDSGLPEERSGLPAILYFTTPDCASCKTIQRPALKRLQETLPGRLQVIEVDATQRPDLASRWGVLSVPTTFLIDAQGQLRHVNHGAARAEKLMKQLEEMMGKDGE